MPSKKHQRRPAADAVQRALPTIPSGWLDQLVTGPMTAAAVEDTFQAFKKALIERALAAELTHHLGYEPGQDKPEGVENQRNGTSDKTVLTDTGALRIAVPRDRLGGFDPLLIPKHQRRFTEFDDKVVALYARGMTLREIQGFVQEAYGVEVSAEFISSVTDAVMAEVGAWQSRPLERLYPVVFFDALRVKIREDAVVRNKAVYLALGILPDGSRDILGLWIENTEGAKFWLKVFNDLKTRGVEDILIAVTDGLKGMGDALEAVFPATTLQTCIVHLIRNSLDYASWKDRKDLAAAIKPIYKAVSAEAAECALNAFEQGAWGRKFPTVTAAWRRAWDKVIPFFAFPPEVRRVIYTTNCHRKRQRQAAKNHQNPRPFPQRRGGHQVDLAGPAQHHGRLGTGLTTLEGGHESVCHPVPRTLCQGPCVRWRPTCPPRLAFVASDAATVDKSPSASNTKILTLPPATRAVDAPALPVGDGTSSGRYREPTVH